MAPSELAQALLKVQAELKPLPRKRKGQAGNRSTKYADLADFEEAVFPLLNRVGLVWMTKPVTREDGRFVLYYAMIHAATGEREDGEYPLHEGTGQQKGSEITYARRHCLGAITGAVAEGDDDDASRASEPRGSQGRPRQPQRPAAPVTRARTTGADHERVRHGTVEATPDDRPAQRNRGPLPAEDNKWQDIPEEERPGSASEQQVRSVAITYSKMGYKSSERDLMLSASESIIGRVLNGPHKASDGSLRTHKNLSWNEAVKLQDTLDSTDRARLEDDMARAAS